MSADDAQKSEAHAVTEDASTSPLAAADRPGEAGVDATSRPDSSTKLIPAPPRDVHILLDETSDGGPLVIESTDPDLAGPGRMTVAP